MIKLPLYLQIIAALVLATIVGILLGTDRPSVDREIIKHLALPCDLIIKALRTLATPLIFLAIIHTFLTADIPGKSGRKLFGLLMGNTTVAIIIGLIVANVLQPGVGSKLPRPTAGTSAKPLDPFSLISDLVPDSILKPLVDNNVISLIFVALAFGIVLRAIKTEQIARSQTEYLTIERVIDLLFKATIGILHWVIALVPVAVFGIVSKTIALYGFESFKSLGSFVIAVLLALGTPSYLLPHPTEIRLLGVSQKISARWS